jgi:hypothetical protein
MKRIVFVVAFLGLFSKPLLADPIDGYVALIGGVINHSSSIESGSRKAIRAEFTRLSSYISIDFRLGTGLGYLDSGGAFKVFKHWNFFSDSGTGISLGLGAGASYVNKVDSPSIASGTIASNGSVRGFTDVFVAPFLRFIYDFRQGFGLIGEFEYNYVPIRYFTGTIAPRNDRTARGRTLFSIGLAFEI